VNQHLLRAIVVAPRAGAIAVTATAMFLPHEELNWRGTALDSRFAVLLGAMVSLWQRQ